MSFLFPVNWGVAVSGDPSNWEILVERKGKKKKGH